ncbi:hypothetical protein N3K66_005109 [Trichothecium roseum]|uniref:Uncharacterized protein n=1 Tax=Trichothecium roseum TaxID=47278 RepID=A0ACC0V3A1_9HYPO|nr:hypothetical protein N3K66_005109 [Trichothecium roseum]
MSVDIEPLELSFQRPFTVEVSRTLTIKNPSTTPVAFKVKTTAPKQYCVRPNAGRIEPGQDFDVTVLLQAMKQEPAPGTKCRDKFLVQSAAITPDQEFSNIASVLDTKDKSHIQERKIRVLWLDAGDGSAAADAPAAAVTPSKRTSAVNGATDTPDASRTFASPSSSNPASAPPPYTDSNENYDDSKSEANQTTVSAVTNTVASTVQLSYEQIKEKLAQAEAQIAALKDNGGLRQRNVKGSNDGGSSAPAQQAQAIKPTVQGVPVKITAILCLIAFLTAYFFF